MKGADVPELEVYHDGECPVCRMEVRYYRRLDKAGRIRWTDIVALADSELPAGKTRAELLGRFHAREPGEAGGSVWHVGVDAFARIWQALPGFRHFAWIFSVPGIRQAAKLAYLGFLRWQAKDRARRQRTAHSR
jgi:predicted DCC family thiol-disulfide oxidoreductase YuxK